MAETKKQINDHNRVEKPSKIISFFCILGSGRKKNKQEKLAETKLWKPLNRKGMQSELCVRKLHKINV